MLRVPRGKAPARRASCGSRPRHAWAGSRHGGDASLLGYSGGITAPPPGSAVSVASAVLIAVEESADFPPAPFAADEVRTLAGYLEGVGVTKARQTLLVGLAATRSAAESRLRRL